jgi:signal transduction histidine kinase
VDFSEDVRERLAGIGEIAAEIAHELHNILQTISASAYVVRLELRKGDTQAAVPHVAKIERSAQTAHAIVGDLMALARGDAIGAEAIALAEVLANSRADWPPGAAEWRDAIEPPALAVRAHGPLLARVLHALFENAIQASAPRPPVVTTRARAQAGHVVIDVADDGPGVLPAIAERLFDPLVTGKQGGTGLGLALARRIVEAHGGTIALVRSAETGAAFSIELPSVGG